MKNNPLLKIKDYGQSIWMDYLDRELIESGELKQMIETYAFRGVTSNPAIFEKAITGNRNYDAEEAGIREGKSVKEIYELDCCDLDSAIAIKKSSRHLLTLLGK